MKPCVHSTNVSQRQAFLAAASCAREPKRGILARSWMDIFVTRELKFWYKEEALRSFEVLKLTSLLTTAIISPNT